jgi:hypothetical protein
MVYQHVSLTITCINPPGLCADQQYWQWPEAKLKPWRVLREVLHRKGTNLSFTEKIPKIVWRGAPELNPVRQVSLENRI